MLPTLNYTKVFSLLFSIFASISSLYAQTPGNVSTNLNLWLKADALPLGGTQSANWQDAHSSNNHGVFFASPGGFYEVTSNINFNKSINFNDDWFDSPLNIDVPNLNVFIIYKLNSNGATPLWGNGLNGSNDGVQVTSNNLSFGGNTGYSGANTTNQVYLNHINSIKNNTSSIFINGNTPPTTVATGAVPNTQVHTGIYIGKENSNTTPVTGNNNLSIAEVIAYTGNIGQNQRERINSYLAIKYGITLSHNYITGAGSPLWDQTTNIGFSDDIVGIARDNSSALNQTQSKSENAGSVVTISRSTVPNDNALLIGNNGGLIGNSTPFQDDNLFLTKGNRINRIWKCQKTGGFNTFDINIRNNISLPSGFTSGNIFLLVSDNASFNSNLRAYPLVGFNASNVMLNDGDYFTIGRSDAALWVKGDGANNNITGGTINSYHDQVMGVNTMTGYDISGGLPNHTLGTAGTAINFNPYATFNQNSKRNFLERPSFTGFGESGTSIFMVLRRDDNSTGAEAMMSYGIGSSAVQANEWVIDDPGDIEVYVEVGIGNGHEDDYDIEDNIPHVVANVRGDNIRDHLRLDGDNDDENYKNGVTIDSRGRLIFGQEQDDLSYNSSSFDTYQEYEGDFAEAIVFNTRVGDDDRDVIESYLAVKYGITLIGDYKMYDGNTLVTTWDEGNNNAYHRNIGGIGRDDAFQLNQQKSKSQNGSTSEVTIQHSGSFPTNASHLIWGANDRSYDNINTNGAPPGYKLSRKVWKVQNYSNRINNVIVTLPVPPSLSGQVLTDVRLVVSNNQNFAAGAITQYTGTANNGEITFPNVSLPNNHYFTIGLTENAGYFNLDPGAPATFEACPGSNVEFSYANLSNHPDTIELRDTTGAPLLIAVTPINQSGSGSNRNGTITLTIPTNAGTGNVQLLLGSTVLYNFNGNLVIHNPELNFLAQNNPICATDTVPLVGFPSGGTFSSPASNFISNGNLIGNNLGWTNVNDEFISTPVFYTYTPTYINGTPCLQSITKGKFIQVRDNRLDEVIFNYIISDPPSNNAILRLNDTIINSISPNLLLDTSFTYPISFSGTYVLFDSITGNYEFLTDQANIRNPVTISYNNGGCIGEATGSIDVYPPLQIIGLVDTICLEADTFHFTRDTLPDYAYSRDTIFYSFSNILVEQQYEYNKITRVTTDSSRYQSAIDTISITPNVERYSFTPDSIPSGVDTVAMQMEYTTTITTLLSVNGVLVPTSTTIRDYSFIAFDTVHMQSRPNPEIFNLDTTYCPNTGAVAVGASPEFEYRARTYFEFRGDDAFGFNLLDTLQRDSIFDPIYHYNKHVPNNDRHLNVELIYVVDRYGCVDRDTAYTRIIAPVQPAFYPQPAYCTSDFPTPLTPTFQPNSFTPFSVIATFLPTPGLDTVTRLFDPSIPGSGNHLATLQMIDNFGCRSEFTDTLFVRVPPQIRLEADNPSRTGFCSNETNIPLNTILLSGGLPDTVIYFGAGVTDSILDPSAIFPNSSGGTSPLSVVYTDSFGCEGRDDIILDIRAIPVLRLDSSMINQRYCGNDPAFTINGFVKDGAGIFQIDTGTITGSGVVLTNGTYYYDPRVITVDSSYSDIVQYSYTDSYGCTNSVSELVLIDSIPVVTIAGLNSKYCIDDPIEQLVGLPDSNFQTIGTFYGGPGVNPNTGVLTPLAAGTGRKIVSYTFEDRNACQNTAFDTTIVYGLPSPLFGGYSTQYCTAAANDTLDSYNVPLVGTSYFSYWGSIIADTALGVIAPNLDSSGLKTIYYEFTDSVGCSNVDSVNIFIHPSPDIVINGLDSAYCFNDPEDNISIFPSGPTGNLVNNNMGLLTNPGFTSSGNSILFNPSRDTAGIKILSYIYSDPSTTCADTIIARTSVYKPDPGSYNLNPAYCRSEDTIQITGTPVGGVFSGSGIVGTTNNYIPSIIGTSAITYTVDRTFLYNNGANTLVCSVDTVRNVTVHGLPDAEILSPANNTSFCSTDTLAPLVSGTPGTWDLFTSLSGAVTDTIRLVDTDTISYSPLRIDYYFDTVYYFDPGTAGSGLHYVTYIATDTLTGCQDSSIHSYTVDNYTNILFILDSVYCESDDPISLIAQPANGVFVRNSDTLFGVSPLPPIFEPNPNYAAGGFLPNSIVDTITYTVQAGACSDSITKLVRINPVPQISFRGDTTQAHNVYCLGTDSIPLTPNIQGGIFTGNGVLFGTSAFIPNIARAGHHPIYYNYTDSMTGCSNEYIDTFSVYGMPDVDFAVIGGCQSDSIAFWPNNTILGLNNIFNNNIIDSITNITWEFASGVTLLGNHDNNVIDTVTHVYTSPGVYDTRLIVSNQTYCIDTQTVRLVISPRVSNFPYDESFEGSSADWYAESRDSSHPLLWEWGIDSTAQGIPSDLNNRFWSTQLNGPYTESEDAWVYSPCFDIDSLTRPMVKLDYWCDTRTAADGAVLEYQEEDGTWTPLGQLNRGISWFNSSIITGQPGDQNLAPVGWSGNSGAWTDARYKLDALGNRSNVRFRVAFGSPSVNLGGTFYDGFGFDNFWVGSRTRNVLLETTANVNEPTMDVINDHVYQLVHHSPINQDLVMLQYHCAEPLASDIFHLDNEIVANTRTYFYGISEAGRAYINGKTNGVPRSRYLQDIDFEKDMLVSPKFHIEIDTFHHNSAGIFTMEATVTALVDLTTPNRYRINTVITEDSLSYPNGGSMVHAVVRKDDEAANIFNRSWAAGDVQTVTMSWNHGINTAYQAGNFQAVAFIQEELTREVFQAQSSRDVSGYLVGVDQVAAESELNEINSMNLFPNPAKDYFNVTFDAALEHDYKWKLVGINGVEYQTGTVYTGDQTIQINNYDFPAGVYVFIVYNGNVFSQRKVIINQN